MQFHVSRINEGRWPKMAWKYKRREQEISGTAKAR
jgi:hypothetical protein